MEIELNEKEHKYMDEEGNIIPSVTEIISMISGDAYRNINPAVLEHAAEKGRLVHEWCEMYDYGFTEDSVPAEIVPYCQAYMDFCRDYKPKWYSIESMVYNNAMQAGRGYAGTVDRIGEIDGELCVVDIKTIASPSARGHIKVCCQTAAYSMAAAAWGKRYALYLKPDGKYRLMDCKEYERSKSFDGYLLFTEMYNLYTKINSIGAKNEDTT